MLSILIIFASVFTPLSITTQNPLVPVLSYSFEYDSESFILATISSMSPKKVILVLLLLNLSLYWSSVVLATTSSMYTFSRTTRLPTRVSECSKRMSSLFFSDEGMWDM